MVDLRSRPGPTPRQREAPQQPTTDESAVEAITGIGNIFKTAGDFFVAGAEAQAEGRESFEENKVIGQFVSELETEVIEQGAIGDMDTNEMLARGRALRRKWIANNPGQSRNINAAWSRVLTDHGLKGESFALSPEEEAEEENRKKASALGITPEKYQSIQLQKELNTKIQQDLNIRLTRERIEGAELSNEEASRKRAVREAESAVAMTLNSTTSFALDALNTQSRTLKEMVDNKQISREQAVEELDALQRSLKSSMSSQALGQNLPGIDPSMDIDVSEKLSLLSDSVDNTYEIYRQVLSGEKEADIATNELVAEEKKNELLFLESLNPLEKRIVTATSMLNIDNFLLKQARDGLLSGIILNNSPDPDGGAGGDVNDTRDTVDDEAGDFAKTVGSIPGNIANAYRRWVGGEEEYQPANIIGADGETRKLYLDKVIVENMREANKTSDPKLIQETQNHLRNTLSGLADYEGINNKKFKRPIDRIRAYRDFAKAAASKEFFSFITNNDVKVSQEELDAAANTVRVQLVDKVIPEVRSEWREATRPRGTLTTGEEKVSDEIEPFFDGNSFRFRAKEGAVLPNRALIKELNENVSGLMNTIIRATAHLENHDNYERVWNQQFSQIFGEGEEDAD